MGADRLTRLDADLIESAAAEGRRQHRSARQQLEHWTRIGREVSSQRTIARSRVEAALAGRLPLTYLTDEEGVVYNAEVASAIAHDLTRTDYSTLLAAEGITTVSLNDDGRLVELKPDGTSTIVDR
ncbi:hypothetical protein HH308_17230 [Gordonia sp. TBRC 11910]|uniref:ParD-like antitoxin of type II toxin-antitoxin system n=1 Tax=Gordonia asplenii TaxID=2725283 RepID=A0A848KXW5_9ACTN|nr:hypothetical protein [Gordonia asplenii]NMO02957.1 hypothetical protein [Gordonia asplenii]